MAQRSPEDSLLALFIGWWLCSITTDTTSWFRVSSRFRDSSSRIIISHQQRIRRHQLKIGRTNRVHSAFTLVVFDTFFIVFSTFFVVCGTFFSFWNFLIGFWYFLIGLGTFLIVLVLPLLFAFVMMIIIDGLHVLFTSYLHRKVVIFIWL